MNDLGAPVPAPPAGPEKSSSFFANLMDLYFSPGEAFTSLLRKPGFLVPMALHLSLSLGFTAIWLQKTDAHAFMKARMEESGRVPPERVDEFAARQAGSLPMFAWVGGALGPPIAVLVLAGVLLFVYRFFYSSEVNFSQSLTIVASTFAALALISTPLLLGVLALKGDWTIAPQEALHANLSLLLDKQSASKWLWALLSSFDLFTFWVMFLLAAGFGAASKRNWSWALAGILVPWALWVACKVGFSFLM